MSHWLTFRTERLEDLRVCFSFHYVGDLPREIVGVLDAGVGSETIERGVAVDGIAKAESIDCEQK